MTIQDVAKKYRLKTRVDDCGETVIPGKLGQLYMHDENENLLGALFMPEPPMKGWLNRKRELTKLGAVVVQNGDMEGAVAFPAFNEELVRTAMRLLGVNKKRTVSPERKKKLVEALKKARTNIKRKTRV